MNWNLMYPTLHILGVHSVLQSTLNRSTVGILRSKVGSLETCLVIYTHYVLLTYVLGLRRVCRSLGRPMLVTRKEGLSLPT